MRPRSGYHPYAPDMPHDARSSDTRGGEEGEAGHAHRKARCRRRCGKIVR